MRMKTERRGIRIIQRKILSLFVAALMVFALLPMSALAAGSDTLAGTDHPTFSDLRETDGLYPAVRYLTQQGILNGLPGGAFHPEASLTRAEAAKIAVLLEKVPLISNGNPTFRDVPASHWANSYIKTATEAELLKGYPDGTFAPEAPITRAEAATLLLRLSGGTLSNESMAISDVPTDFWAYHQAVTAVKAGLMGLSSDGFFVPDAAFTRGELAQNLVTLITLGPALRGAELVGTLTIKLGTVTVTGSDGISRALTKDQQTTVTTGMTIATEAGSRGEISYDDGSGFRVEPDTQLSVIKSDGYRYMKPDGTSAVAVDKLELKMDYGRIFGALANRNEGTEENYIAPADEGSLAWWQYTYASRERIMVDSSSGVTGVFGTFWGNLVNNNPTSASEGLDGTPGGGETVVLVGHAEVSVPGGVQPPVVISGGQATTVPPATPGGTVPPPTPPVPMSPQQIQQLSGASDWILQTAQQIQTGAPPPPPPPTAPPVQQQTQPGQTPVVPSTPPVVTPPPVNVTDVISQALNQAAGGTTVPAPTGSSDSGSGPSYTPPTITGPDTINLTGDYGSYQQLYTFGGYPSPTYSINADTDLIVLSGNNLTVLPGLDADTYSVTLEASNAAGTATKTVTVNVSSAAPTETAPTIDGPSQLSMTAGETLSQPYTIGGNPAPAMFGIDWGGAEEYGAVSFDDGILAVSDEMPAGEYMFTLRATNTAGTGTLTVTLTVNEAPDTVPVISGGPNVILLQSGFPMGVYGEGYETTDGNGEITYSVVSAYGTDDVDYKSVFVFNGMNLTINAGSVLTTDHSPYTVTLRAMDSDETDPDLGEKTVTVYVLSLDPVTIYRGMDSYPPWPLTVLGGGNTAFAFELARDEDTPEWIALYGNTLYIYPGEGDLIPGTDYTVQIEISVSGGNPITCPITIHVADPPA